MKIQPLHDKVLLVRLKAENTTAAGIIVEKGLGDVDKGKVVSVGSDVTDVKENDVVLINWNKATLTKIDNIPFYIVKQEDIVGVYD